MVFSSMVFLCIFLPVVFLLHLILPGTRAKNGMLLLASLLFYAYGEPIYVLLMIGSAFLNYTAALCLEKWPRGKKAVLGAAVIVNLAILVVFKYTGFLVETTNSLFGLSIPVPEIRLPIGISFFTFQAMSYLIDVFRGGTRAQKNFGRVLLYISFFPQLIAGPIVKYHDIEQEILHRTVTTDGVAAGISRFSAGLAKKVLIANHMGLAADHLFALELANVNAAAAWVGAVSYMLQIYFDFSGYSDMAIGLGEMFGFHFRENFNYPYISGSIREFWRRWHMSLSGWFLEYLYIPLGGNRKGKFRTSLNKMIVFLCTGIWHGANLTFLFWGVYHGFFLMLEEYVPAIRERGGRVKSVLQHVYTILVVMIGFVFFRADTFTLGCRWGGRMFTGFAANPVAMSLTLGELTPVYLTALAVGAVTACPVTRLFKEKSWYEPAAAVGSILALALSLLSLAGGTYNPFIYFRF